jgi:activator of HSP90 ATPase
MGKTITINDRVILPGTPHDVYLAFIDGGRHAEFTGSPAFSDPRLGGKFSAWDGYIYGKYLELELDRRIVQEWISSDFPTGASPSQLVIVLRSVEEGVELTMIHSGVPEEIADGVRRGWEEYYWSPLKDYLSKNTI